MPRFVILTHDHPFAHYDLMLERGDDLATWRIVELPCDDSSVRAEWTFPHRRLYLDYEGPISGDRGTVARWEVGSFEWVCDEPEVIVIEVKGERHWNGRVELRRLNENEWTLRLIDVRRDGSAGRFE